MNAKVRLLIPAVFVVAALSPPGASGAEAPGLIARYRLMERPEVLDEKLVDHPALYVPAGESATPFLPAGPFEARWSGFILVDLRSDCSFKADLSGEIELLLNGERVLHRRGTGESTAETGPVRLNKGKNRFEAVFRSPSAGDAMFRLWWSDGDGGMRPLARTSLRREEGEASTVEAMRVRMGRDLFFEFRCGRCHFTGGKIAAPDGAVPAASLEKIGGRRNEGWMARWILDPEALRPGARMPRMGRGMGGAEGARAISHYLGTLGKAGEPARTGDPVGAEGRALFENLHCGVCHGDPETGEAGKVSLAAVREKFVPGALVEFLRDPRAHYEWIRMPDFGLTLAEAGLLAAYLEGEGSREEPLAGANDPSVVERGRSLVQTSGCLNCHELGLKNLFSAPALGELGAEGGCLDGGGGGANAPEFALSPEQRQALAAFLRTDRMSLVRHCAPEFAERQMRQLGCAECHGVLPGFPALGEIGGKLKPEWMERFLSGEIPYKPRPWLSARMPSFGVRARTLAHGLAMRDGFGPKTMTDDLVDPDRVAVGRRLVGKDGGFACVACHALGARKATDVFDGEGINLAHASDRLQYAFFRRWLLDPVTIDPMTKMPDYFDGLESPFTEVYDGDAARQVESIWHFLRSGSVVLEPAGER